MATTKEKWQEIANRGLQDKFDPATRAKFDEAVNRGLITLQPQAQPLVNNIDVPAGGTGPAFPDRPVQPERTLGENLEGAIDTGLALATGATGGALGFGVGSVGGAIGELTGLLEPGEGRKLAQDFGAALTRTPKSEAGKEFIGGIGQALGSLPPVGLTGGVLPKFGLPSAVGIPKLSKSRNSSIASLGDSASDLVRKSFQKKLGNDRFEPRIFNMVKETRKQGFDDAVTTMIANANPTTKERMLRQVGIVEAGKGDAKVKALTRTADEAGGALVQQIDFAKAKNKQAGSQLGAIATKFKDDKVNMVEPVNEFIRSMDEQLGVTFEKNMKPIFKDSDIETFPESIKLVNDLALKIKRTKSPTALDAHKFKRLIDKSVTYGKSDGKLDRDLEHIAKKLRGDINDTLSAKYPEYKEANKQFSETITVLDDLQSVAGRKLDFSGKHANKAAGTLLRSQTNNTKGRANLLTAIEELEITTNKYGGKFDDDILALSIFSDELDAVFGSGARTSLRGEVGKAGVDSAIDISQMTIPGALAVGAKAGAKRLRGINEVNQLKAIKRLLRGN